MPLELPPTGAGSLAGLRARALGGRLFRVWREVDGGQPWWFSSTGRGNPGGRFDLAPPMGTCYLGRSPAAAVLEALQLHLTKLSTEDLKARRMATVEVPVDAPAAADLGAEAGTGVGVTAELWAGVDREMTQAWAQALRRDGWWALDYPVRHDPSATARAVALFDHNGAHAPTHGTWAYTSGLLIDDSAVAGALARHGVAVVAPGELPIIEPDLPS